MDSPHTKAPAPSLISRVEVEAAAQDVLAEKPERLGLFDGNAEVLDRQGIFMPNVNVAILRADGISIDEHAFDHGMGVAFHERTVHERARVSLVAVAHNSFHLCARFLGMLPLEACGEARAASSAKSGLLDDIDDFVWLHLGHDFGQACIAILADRVIDIAGVDKAVPVERHALLLFVKRDILHRHIRISERKLTIELFPVGHVMEHGIGEQAGDVAHLDFLVERLLRLLDHDRTALAESLTTGLHNLEVDTLGRSLFFEFFDQFIRTRSLACRAAANPDSVRFLFRSFLFQLGTKRSEIGGAVQSIKREFHVHSSL